MEISNIQIQKHFLLPLKGRTYAINFKSRTETALPKDLFEKAEKAVLDSKNMIGKGSEGIVFQIPFTDYCIKIHRIESRERLGSWIIAVTEKDKVNHVVAKSTNGADIMKKIKGKTLKHYKKPESLYSLPEESYRDFLKQISNAYKNGLDFDYAPSNIIFNEETKKLTAIDFKRQNLGENIHICPFTKAFISLEAKPINLPNKKLNRKLFSKFLNILLEELSNNQNSEIIVNVNDIFVLFTKFKINQLEPLPKQFKFLEQAIFDIFSIKQQIAEGQNLEKELNDKIKSSKAIIKQIFG